MEKHFKPILLVLLFGILVSLIAIYLKLPVPAPTFGDYRNASGKQREQLNLRRPMLYVSDGNISIDGSVDVTGTVDIGNTPLEVEASGSVSVDNTPLEVEIVR